MRQLVAPGVGGVRRHRVSFRLDNLAAQGEAIRHGNLGASLNLYSLYRFLHSCKYGLVVALIFSRPRMRPLELGVHEGNVQGSTRAASCCRR